MKMLTAQKTLIGMCILGIISCSKPPVDTSCVAQGVIKGAHQVNATCDGFFIQENNGTIYHVVQNESLITGVKPGDRVRFGFEEVKLGMRGCGGKTIKLTCFRRIY